MTPERAKLLADLEEIVSRGKPKPRLPKPAICVNGRIIASAVVIVSPSDVNWWRAMAVRRNGEIQVRPDWRRR